MKKFKFPQKYSSMACFSVYNQTQLDVLANGPFSCVSAVMKWGKERTKAGTAQRWHNT